MAVKKNRWRPMRRKLFGHWLWIPCRMTKKKVKGRHGCFPRQVFPHVNFIQSRAYRKFVIRRFQREGYFTIGCPSIKYRSPE